MTGTAALTRLGEAGAAREAMAPAEPLIAADLLALYDGQPMRYMPIPDPIPVITRRALVTVSGMAVTVGLLVGGTLALVCMVIGASLGHPTPGVIMGVVLGLPVAVATTVIPGARIALALLPQATQQRMAHAIEHNALREVSVIREHVRAGVGDGDVTLDTAMDVLAHAAPHTDPRLREH